MTILDHYKYLDLILSEFSNNIENPIFGVHTKNSLLGKLPYSIDLYKNALRKLHKDGYVIYNEQKETLIITFEGYTFIGYVNQYILDNERLTKISQIEKSEDNYKSRLLCATWSAGIAAVLLLIWQIFLWMFPKTSDFLSWLHSK